jgi:flagellar basal-body rod modification protein FlgD
MATLEFNAASGRDQFLQLLVTQLQHQDPLEPVGQEDFLQQLAQFSTVEGVEKLNASFADFLSAQQLSTGFNLAGKSVEYTDADTGAVLTGRVDAVSLTDGRVTLQIGGAGITLDQVTTVLADAG